MIIFQLDGITVLIFSAGIAIKYNFTNNCLLKVNINDLIHELGQLFTILTSLQTMPLIWRIPHCLWSTAKLMYLIGAFSKNGRYAATVVTWGLGLRDSYMKVSPVYRLLWQAKGTEDYSTSVPRTFMRWNNGFGKTKTWYLYSLLFLKWSDIDDGVY
jgi:hypothetical protein